MNRRTRRSNALAMTSAFLLLLVFSAGCGQGEPETVDFVPAEEQCEGPLGCPRITTTSVPVPNPDAPPDPPGMVATPPGQGVPAEPPVPDDPDQDDPPPMMVAFDLVPDGTAGARPLLAAYLPPEALEEIDAMLDRVGGEPDLFVPGSTPAFIDQAAGNVYVSKPGGLTIVWTEPVGERYLVFHTSLRTTENDLSREREEVAACSGGTTLTLTVEQHRPWVYHESSVPACYTQERGETINQDILRWHTEAAAGHLSVEPGGAYDLEAMKEVAESVTYEINRRCSLVTQPECGART